MTGCLHFSHGNQAGKAEVVVSDLRWLLVKLDRHTGWCIKCSQLTDFVCLD